MDNLDKDQTIEQTEGKLSSILDGEARCNISPPPQLSSHISQQNVIQVETQALSSIRNASNEELREGIILNEDGENVSRSDDDYESDSESQYEETIPDVSYESFNEKIIFEHTLKHSSFFENARDRRRRHLKNRLRGTIPMLHFTGSHKTDFWGCYGVKPDRVVPLGNIKGVHSIFSEEEFKKLGPTERRIHVNGQKFKIVANQEETNSLYRAIAKALGMVEDEYKIIRKAILHELIKQWPIFCIDVCAYCGKNVTVVDAAVLDAAKMVEKYKNYTVGSSSPPLFELVAAGLHFGFSFSVMELTTSKQPITVKNCTNEQVLSKSTAKCHFLKTGKAYSYYEFLLPIGPLKKIPDGIYPTVLRDVILVEKYRSWHSKDIEEKPKHHPAIGSVPVGFAVDHRIFFHRTTISHDLWSLLAELIFRKLIYAPQIKSRILDSKHDFTLYYLACKAKKRYQTRGNASIEKLADEFSQRFSKESPRGDLEDLAQAALYFNFSYTVIGVDSRGNFFWRDYVTQDEPKKNGPYLAFFVKTTPDKTMFWYALEDVGRACPKERRLYQDVQSGDLQQWGGKFYFHNIPTKPSSFIDQQVSSSKNLLEAPTRMLSQATKWATSNFGKLLSVFAGTISGASIKTESVFQSIIGYLGRFKKPSQKVHPDKKLEALYIREQP